MLLVVSPLEQVGVLDSVFARKSSILIHFVCKRLSASNGSAFTRFDSASSRQPVSNGVLNDNGACSVILLNMG